MAEIGHIEAVLGLPNCSHSLEYRAWLAPVGRVPFLQWFVQWFAHDETNPPLRLLVHSEQDKAAIERTCKPGRYEIFWSRHYSLLAALAQLARETGADHLVLFGLALAFAPRDLAKKVVARHLQDGNDCTFVAGLPPTACPEVYRSSLIEQLTGLSPALLAFPPRTLVDRVLDFSRQSADGSRLRFGLYNPLSDYTAVPAHIPAKLEIRSESDVGVARRVIDGVGPAAFATPSLEPLKAWKEECIRGRLERRTELFASIGRIPRRRPGRIRVTFVSVASAFSGAEEALCQLAAGIDTERFELSAMVGLDGLFAKKLRSRGVHVFCAGSDFSATNLDSFLYCNAALRSLATDVAHVNAAAGAPFLIAAAVNGVKLVYHLRQAELHQGHEEYVLASEATIAVSNFVKEEALRLDVPPGKITVIYDGVDTEHFNPCHKQKGQACQQLGLDPDRTIVVMIARFAPNKRHELLLEAISLIREKTGPVTIVFVGEVFSDPRHHECVRAKAAACGLSDVVTYLGFQEDIRTVHAAADILVLCSEREPLGQCVLEAMAMGVPVVITDSGGLSELVRDGHTGFVIPAGESASLAECISYLIAQPDRRAAVGEAARDYVMRDVTTRATAATVMELYESVVGSRETCEAIADSAAPSVRLSRCQ